MWGFNEETAFKPVGLLVADCHTSLWRSLGPTLVSLSSCLSVTLHDNRDSNRVSGQTILES